MHLGSESGEQGVPGQVSESWEQVAGRREHQKKRNPKEEDASDDDDDVLAKKAKSIYDQGHVVSEEVARQQQEEWNYWTGAGSSDDHLRSAADYRSSINASARSEESSEEAKNRTVTKRKAWR